MDVMLTIRAQETATSTAVARPVTSTTNYPTNEIYDGSISSRSAHSLKALPKAPASPTTAVAALKNLFTSSRPRSGSRAASIKSERPQDRDVGEESFARVGSSLLSILRSSTPDAQSVASIQNTVRTDFANPTPAMPIERRLDNKILKDSHSAWENADSANKDARSQKRLSLEVTLPLHPPPRKRWTSISQSTPPTAVENLTASSNNNSGRSSLSISQVPIDKSELDRPSSSSHFQFGTPEQRPRAPSLQSVSTFASVENRISMERSSGSMKRSSTSNSRRWSRQSNLTSRVSPPSDSSITSGPGDPHPSFNSSRDSQKSLVSGLPSFSNRTSLSESLHSVNSSNANHNAGATSTRVRSSMPPPPRPAPTSALPPAPVGVQHPDVPKPSETDGTKTSVRSSSTQRASRLSLMTARPPPITGLPPRPDEPTYKAHHRRMSSEGSVHRYSAALEVIPGSPAVSSTKARNISPHPLPPPPPPPSGPLPLPPPPDDQIPHKRLMSLRQRLRMLSTGSVTGQSQTLGKLGPLTERATGDLPLPAHFTTTSTPATPIAEKIMPFQDDSFLQMHTPVMSTYPTTFLGKLPPQDLLLSRDSEIAEVTSLSPPPRRGFKQMTEVDFPPQKITEDKLTPIDELNHSPSPPGSPVIPMIDDSQNLFETIERSSLGEESVSPGSSSVDDKINSYVDSRHVSLSRPSSVISLGI